MHRGCAYILFFLYVGDFLHTLHVALSRLDRNTDEGESNGTLSLGNLFNEIPFKDERKKKKTNSSSHSHSYTGQQFLNNSNTNSNKASSKNSNKKEIPVPTITIVRRYDRDVAPDYDIPQSYVRYVCPSYNEVLEDTVDYNLDAEDEAWWRNNQDFGPSATANIIVEGGGEGGRTEAAESGSGHRSAAVPIFGISHNIKIEVAWVYFSRLKAFIFDAFHSTRLVVPAHSLKATLH